MINFWDALNTRRPTPGSEGVEGAHAASASAATGSDLGVVPDGGAGPAAEPPAAPEVRTPDPVGAELGELDDWLRSARDLAGLVGAEELARELDVLSAERRRAGFRVAIVGEFNRGKSTLVNGLVGMDLLPTGPVPTTRNFVLVTGADTPALRVRWPDGSIEIRPSGPGMWDGLVIDDEADGGGAPPAAGGEPDLQIEVPSEWLARTGAEVIDTPGTNEALADRLLQVRSAVTLSDCTLLVVSALSPLSQTERALLEQEVLRRRIPFVAVVVSFLDQVEAVHRDDVMAALANRLRESAPAVPVLAGPPPEGGTAELAAIRQQLAEFAARSETGYWRARKIGWSVAEICAAVADVADSAVSAFQLSAQERHAEVERGRAAMALDRATWEHVRVQLDTRRLALVGRVRVAVLAGRATMADNLTYELERASDPKAFWDQELPLRARRELVALAGEAEAVVLRGVAADVDWLEQTMTERFGAGGAVTRPRVAVEAPRAQPGATVADIGQPRTLTRLGAASGAIVGYLLGGAVSVVFPPALVGVAGGVAGAVLARRSLQHATDGQRGEVAAHLQRFTDEVVERFTDQVARDLDQLYLQLVGELSRRRAAWQESRLAALAEPKAGSEVEAEAAQATYTRAASSARTLAAHIRAAIDGDTGRNAGTDTGGTGKTEEDGNAE